VFDLASAPPTAPSPTRTRWSAISSDSGRATPRSSYADAKARAL